MSKEVNDWYTKIYPGDTEIRRAYSKRNAEVALKGILPELGEKRLVAMDRCGVAALLQDGK